MQRAHLLLLSMVLLPLTARAGDWPQWGGTASRNMVSAEKGLPDSWEPGKTKGDTDEIDLATTKNVKWVVKLGSAAYGNTTVGGGKVLIGTNNETPRDPKHKGDRGVVMCFEEATGKFLWQLVVPKLGAGKVSDFENVGICSPPTIDGDRVYLVTNRCEVLCLDLNGMANGNDGPFKEEAQYMAGPGNAPIEAGPTDADIIWRYDMRDQLGVFPYNMTSSAVLVVGDKLFVTTSNSIDWTNKHIPSPGAPALICLDKKSGQLLGQEASGISARTFHSNWCSPAYGMVNGKGMVVLGGGDGFCYGFDPEPVKQADGTSILKEIWRCDCNPPAYRMAGGKRLEYGNTKGPSEVLATPVILNGKVYASVGQDPSNGEGVGALTCINASGTGNISATGKVWTCEKVGRSISTVAIVDDLLFTADYSGNLYCIDTASGKVNWQHDAEAHLWASPLVVDGKIYIANESGVMFILAAAKEKKVIGQVDFSTAVYSTAVAANGALYVATEKNLYAIAKK